MSISAAVEALGALGSLLRSKLGWRSGGCMSGHWVVISSTHKQTPNQLLSSCYGDVCTTTTED